ncbi:MAG TPA: hypothetical protein VN445_09480 [Rectinemataceae bacterium]|nr:hypothetical protein [Rectinemataceae bacterium]
MFKIHKRDIFGLLHSSIDVHTLGMLSFTQVLEECGIESSIADEAVSGDMESLSRHEGGGVLRAWLLNRRISALGFSYRLDPADALRLFDALREFLHREKLLHSDGGAIRGLFFAGLPEACEIIAAKHPDLAGAFRGDEAPHETMRMLGIPEDMVPPSLSEGLKYDAARMAFGEALVKAGHYNAIRPVDRSGYPGFGARGDRLTARIARGVAQGLPPLMRVHAGPYLPDRAEAVRLFSEWVRRLASGGYLDVLSIGTSQLSQSNFGDNWEGAINGGGVPLNSAAEFAAVWEAARPMLVRTYAGTKDVPALAKMYEETIDIAWHALSLWWFCRLDGRGPNTVLENLGEHFAAMRYIVSTGKPLEMNVPHHFAFRGSDDLGYIVSGYVAAKAAKLQGIKHLVLQTMLNTPKYTWGIQDLAKARTLLKLVRGLEDSNFKVFLQPRGGLDYFSPDPDRAKAQLAAVTAMMDDIEPHDGTSPQIIHVVSYSEAYRLADPPIIEESVRITRYALQEYRRLRRLGAVDDMAANAEVAAREKTLYDDARAMIKAVETLIPDTYSPYGLYAMLSAGAFALPWLTSCREEFQAANIGTRAVNGGVHAVDAAGSPLSVEARIETLRANLAGDAGAGGHHGG